MKKAASKQTKQNKENSTLPRRQSARGRYVVIRDKIHSRGGTRKNVCTLFSSPQHRLSCKPFPPTHNDEVVKGRAAYFSVHFRIMFIIPLFIQQNNCLILLHPLLQRCLLQFQLVELREWNCQRKRISLYFGWRWWM